MPTSEGPGQQASRHPRPSVRFGTPALGDARLDRRPVNLVHALAEAPSAPVPDALGADAEVEAFYRLVRNRRVEVLAVPRRG